MERYSVRYDEQRWQIAETVFSCIKIMFGGTYTRLN